MSDTQSPVGTDDRSDVGREADNRSRFIRAKAVTKWMRDNMVPYSSQHAYSSAHRCAVKGGLRTTNGMLVHTPEKATLDTKRTYLLWEGQTVEELKYAIAELAMVERRAFVVMCMTTDHYNRVRDMDHEDND